MTILIRCDASLNIGSGHVMRCRTLALELQKYDENIVFVCRRQPGDMINLLRREFRVITLEEQQIVSCEGREGRELYEAWLGCDQRKDVDNCIQSLKKTGINEVNWIVVDHYGLDSWWESAIRKYFSGGGNQPKILAIDDLADRKHTAEILLDQNYYGEVGDSRYIHLVNKDCNQLLGPNYALIAAEYKHIRSIIPPRKEVKRVLIYFGGTDKNNLTGRTLQALMNTGLENLTVDVVVGQQSENQEEIKLLARKRGNTNVYGSMESLAGLIARADLAIGAGGATTWERACLGLPSLVITVASNQDGFSKKLHEAKHINLLGNQSRVTIKDIRSAIVDHINQPTIGKSLKALTDGWGAQRVAIAMQGEKRVYKLKDASNNEEGLIQQWQNSEKEWRMESGTYSSKRESKNENYKLYIDDPNRIEMIATTKNGCPIGHISFERDTKNTVQKVGMARLNMHIDRCIQNRGVEGELVRMGLQEIEQRWKSEGKGWFVKKTLLNSKSSNSRRRDLTETAGSKALKSANITILSDRDSWVNKFMPELIECLWLRDHSVRWIHDPKQLVVGDVALLLSCGSLISGKDLDLNRHNLVVHASDLPRGKGWSPMTWQILEGNNSIPITLFEAAEDLDSGKIYSQEKIELKGTELIEEWQEIQFKMTIDICVDWFERYHEKMKTAKIQTGEETQYRRRRPKDSHLDIEIPLVRQFNLLRVVDNQNYPAFFQWKNDTYQLRVNKMKKHREKDCN